MSDIILKATGINIHYEMELHQANSSLRDLFISLVNNPVQALLKNRDALHVVKDFNLTLRKGERLGIIGVNGTGKTSLCRVIAGIFHPTSGEIEVNGETRAVFDTNVGIQPELTGKENAILLSYFLYPHAPKQERMEIVNEALHFSELGKFINAPFKNYSKGMQVRLSLSLVTGTPTDLLVLDEVFDGADHFFQKKVSERTLNMIKRSSAAIIISHNPEQIRISCNRIIVLGKQKILFHGNVEEGLEYYSLHEEKFDDALS